MSESIRLSDHFSYSKLLRFTLPSICMMVFTSIYGVVDGLFVSNFVGKTPFAAINLVMPFVMILGGMGFMIGTGGTALVSKLLGEGKDDDAQQTFSMMVLFTLLLAAVTVLTTLYAPILSGRGVDLIVGQGNVNFPALSKIAIQFGVTVCVTSICQWLMNMVNNRITFQVVRDIRKSLSDSPAQSLCL